jgi:hypothetical protein
MPSANTIQEQIKLVKRNPFAIADIPNPHIDVQLAAVQTNGNAVRSISNPSERV